VVLRQLRVMVTDFTEELLEHDDVDKDEPRHILHRQQIVRCHIRIMMNISTRMKAIQLHLN
jgi:hypothetical protein